MNARTHKLAATLALALVVGVLAAPTAIGSGGPSRDLDAWAYNAVYRSQVTGSATGENATGLRDLDPWAYSRVLSSRASTAIGENATRHAAPAATRPDDHSGNWRDVGIGGAAMLVLVVLVAGGAVLRHNSRQQEAHG